MKNKIEVTIQGLKITITQDNINIKDSYQVRNPFDMRSILKELKKLESDEGNSNLE